MEFVCREKQRDEQREKFNHPLANFPPAMKNIPLCGSQLEFQMPSRYVAQMFTRSKGNPLDRRPGRNHAIRA